MSFIPYNAEHPFPIQNLPLGVFSNAANAQQRPGVAIGDFILDLEALSKSAHYAGAPLPAQVWQKGNLDAYVASQPEDWKAFRAYLTQLLATGSPLATAADRESLFASRLDAKMHLPIKIGDYTDFYASFEHAYNCGVLIRGPDNALQANWKHLPVGYHGRASSVVVSGTPFPRPTGQILDKPTDKQPIFAPSRRLDYELEMGCIFGGSATKMGQRLSPDEARKHIFGYVILNDWSARDVQTWEYVPLGPFLSKNFCTTISPWVVSPDALAPFQAPQYTHDPELLPYLQDPNGFNYAIPLDLSIKAAESDKYAHVSLSSAKHTYYTFAQMYAHHSATGCPINPSDMIGSGTLSAPNPEGLGSLLERSRLGREPFQLDENRKDMTWLRDGDSVLITAKIPAPDGSYSIGFGECEGTVLPAI